MATKVKPAMGSEYRSEFTRFHPSVQKRNNNNPRARVRKTSYRSDSTALNITNSSLVSKVSTDNGSKLSFDRHNRHPKDNRWAVPAPTQKGGQPGASTYRQPGAHRKGTQSNTLDYKLHDSSRDDDRTPSAKSDGRQTRYTQRPGRRDNPVSIEAEYRYILGVTKQCVAELRAFRNRYRTDGFDGAACRETAGDVVKSINLEESEIERADEFRKLLATRKLGQDIQSRPELEHLEILCDKAGKYEEMLPDIQAKLNICVDKHLAKYCLSFIEELKNYDGITIKCTQDYEEAITAHTHDLTERFKDINEMYETYSNKRSPFITGFLSSTEELLPAIDKTVTCGLEICEIIQRWCQADRAYPIRLWEEVGLGNTEKISKQEEIKKGKQQKEILMPVLRRKEIIRDRAAARHAEVRIERRKLSVYKENLAKRLEQTHTELEDKQNQLDDIQQEVKNRKYNNPKYVDKLWETKERLEIEIPKLDERLHMLKRQQERYEKLETDLEEQQNDLEYDVMGKQGDVDDVRSKIRACDQDISQLVKDLKVLENRIRACKSLREMKLSAATLRKIYFQKLDSSSHDVLMEVCKVVSANIGHTWEDLYLDLPFAPPRSTEKRNMDLEKIKHNCVHHDVPGQRLAWQGLQKWRIFHKNGNVQQMLRSLRKLQKYALAHKVEHMHKKSMTRKS